MTRTIALITIFFLHAISPPSFAEQFSNSLPIDKRIQIQILLKQSGVYKGEIDGNIGKMSKEALKEFKQLQGLNPNLQLDANFWREYYKRNYLINDNPNQIPKGSANLEKKLARIEQTANENKNELDTLKEKIDSIATQGNKATDSSNGDTEKLEKEVEKNRTLIWGALIALVGLLGTIMVGAFIFQHRPNKWLREITDNAVRNEINNHDREKKIINLLKNIGNIINRELEH